MLHSLTKKSRAITARFPPTKTPSLAATQRSMASAKEIKFGVEGRAAMLRGVNILADAVQVRNYEIES